MTGLGLCGPEELLHRLPGWKETSWAYHSDGYKYRGSLPGGSDLKYGGQYGSGDTVGCGINMRTGKIFFTKNGFTLGKNCPILPHLGHGFCFWDQSFADQSPAKKKKVSHSVT